MARYVATIDAPPGEYAPLRGAVIAGTPAIDIMLLSRGTEPEATKVRVEVDAPTPKTAVKNARKLYAELRTAAGFVGPPEERPVMLMPVNPLVVFNLNDVRFFTMAESLYDDDHYDFAVVAAQVACELVVEGAVEFALSRHASEPLAKVVPSFVRYGMQDPRSQSVWKALMGCGITEPKQVWDDYCRHVKRRNALIHEGKRISEQQAGESLEAAKAFCRQVAEVLRTL